jgi:hypothetical protein
MFFSSSNVLLKGKTFEDEKNIDFFRKARGLAGASKNKGYIL